jgi:hypothetical protein
MKQAPRRTRRPRRWCTGTRARLGVTLSSQQPHQGNRQTRYRWYLPGDSRSYRNRLVRESRHHVKVLARPNVGRPLLPPSSERMSGTRRGRLPCTRHQPARGLEEPEGHHLPLVVLLHKRTTSCRSALAKKRLRQAHRKTGAALCGMCRGPGRCPRVCPLSRFAEELLRGSVIARRTEELRAHGRAAGPGYAGPRFTRPRFPPVSPRTLAGRAMLRSCGTSSASITTPAKHPKE